ncbi:MAG: adenylyl-sulfate kinase [Myxococcota bacterium]
MSVSDLIVDPTLELPLSPDPLPKAGSAPRPRWASMPTLAEREQMCGHRGAVVWFTGLSGSGKTTVARALGRLLHDRGKHSTLLDGDVLRGGLSRGLGFGPEDRDENIRRFTEVARLFAEAGLVALVSAISPYVAMRRRARERIGADRFVLVHIATPLSVCEARDVKGLYARARAGQIRQFTGIDAPYEEPVQPDLRLSPEDGDPVAHAQHIWDILAARQLL